MYVYMGQAFMFSVSHAVGYRIVYKCTGGGGRGEGGGGEKEEEEEEKEGLSTSNDHQSVGTTRFRVALPPNPPTCSRKRFGVY